MLQAEDRVHFTHLKNIAQSPAHYLTSVEEGFDKAAYATGRLVHYLVLGGVQWTPEVAIEKANFAVYTGKGNRSSNEYKAFVAQFPKDFDIFKADELEECERIAAAVLTDPVVQRLGLLEGRNEELIDWDNEGIPFRSHVDKHGTATSGPRKGRRHLWDLKTTTCSKPEKFHWEARRFHYGAQLATYQDACRSIGFVADDIYIVAVEKAAPFCVVVYELTEAILEDGRKLARVWKEIYKVCEKAQHWPGYVQDVVTFDVLPQNAAAEGAPLMLITHDGSEVAA